MPIFQDPGGNATLPDAMSVHVDKEIRNGFPNQQYRVRRCMRALDYYNLDGRRYIPRRDAESDEEYLCRPKRHIPFTRRVVDLLCSHLYNPGPNRSFKDKTIDDWFGEVSADNMLNCLWQRADRLATLHGLSAFQFAGKGNVDPKASDDETIYVGPQDKPLVIHLWDYSQFVFFADPNDSIKLAHFITIDRFDCTTRYTWYDKSFIRTYQTRKNDCDNTNCGRTAAFKSEIVNPYGCIPFSLVHNELPVGGLETIGLGDYLAAMNATIDIEASDMAQAVSNYHTPLPLLYDGTVEQNILKKSGGFVRVNANPTGMETPPPPRLEYLQAQLDIQGGWDNIRSAITTVLEGLGVPETAYRLNQATLPSGVAQVAEQMPLADYSHARQEPFRRYETNFIKVAMTVAGTYYEDASLVAQAQMPGVSLMWSPPSITIPGPDRDQQDQDSIAMGKESLVDVVMRQYGLTEDEAWTRIEKVAKDNQRLQGMNVVPAPLAPLETDSLDTNNPDEESGSPNPNPEPTS